MASVKVAVRVRPLNARERNLGSEGIIDINGKTITVTNSKIPDHSVGDQHREKSKVFTFDYSYWSVNSSDLHYVSQGQVFEDLGRDIIDCAFYGYNACVFAYGQTGSGKTYTMTGNPGDDGLIPRISNGLFQRMKDETKTYRTEVSYLEIYNEAVRDLLPSNINKGMQTLRVREHPKDGPYVEDLSHHIVTSYEDIQELIDLGNSRRTTAATNMNDVSSRSHALFTIAFTQAKFSSDSPSETNSKIRLVDLAGSERADATGTTGVRLKEGGSINKSLVTLGNVISTLADICDSANHRKVAYIPYRDSVLTWLLKDSLGGNSKTVMIATISPAACNYTETISTLRYANRAKNIINKPMINEDPNVKLIRELRMEIARLKALLGGNLDELSTPKLQEQLSKSEAKVKILTEEWTGRWKEVVAILKEENALALRKDGLGVVLDSGLPHLIRIDDDILSTGIVLYHLKEGQTTIGTEAAEKHQDIVLQGSDIQSEHCVIWNDDNRVYITPAVNAECIVNGVMVSGSLTLSQGDVILIGKSNMFRFNHPLQASKLREEMKESNISLSRTSMLSQSMLEIYRSTENLNGSYSGWEIEQQHKEQFEALEKKRREVEEMEEKFQLAECDWQERQRVQEKELERKTQLLLEMQTEAEKMKRDAEQIQKQVKKEVSDLKQKTTDFEVQLQQYRELGYLDNKGFEQCLRSFKEPSKLSNRRVPVVSNSEQLMSSPLNSTRDIESDLNKIDQSIRLLKKLQVDYNVFESIAPDLDDSVLSKIHLEIQQMDQLLTRIADLNSKVSDQYEEEKNEILSRNAAILAELESKICEKSEVETNIADEINSFLSLQKDKEPGGNELLAGMENSLSNALNARMELVLARDDAQSRLLKELEELDGRNENLLKEMDNAVKEVTEHEVIYQTLVTEVLKINESKRENLLQMMKGITAADVLESNKMVNDDPHVTMENKSGNVAEVINPDQYSSTFSFADDFEENEKTLRPNQLMKFVNGDNFSMGHDVTSTSSRLEHNEDCKQKPISRTKDSNEECEGDGKVLKNLGRQDLKGKTEVVENADREHLRILLPKKLDEGISKPQNLSVTEEVTETPLGNASIDASSVASSSLESFVTIDYSDLESQLANRNSPSNMFRVKIPSSVYRGSGLNTYVEFEVKIAVFDEEWTIFRRYRRFHQLHSDLMKRYPKVSSLAFPPKKLFTTEKVIENRRILLQDYLQKLLDILCSERDYPLHPSKSNIYCKQMLFKLHQFFQKGLFETTKYSAC